MSARDGIERVRAALDQAGVQVSSGRDGSLRARCPLHEGRTATSLAIRHLEPKTGDRCGRAQLRCFAGCDERDVLEFAGLQLRDLYDEEPPRSPSGHRIVREHVYTDPAGHLAGVQRRMEPKTYRPMSPSPDGWQVKASDQFKALPYRLTAVVAAVANDEPVFVVEGERDADALAAYGVVATCNLNGAGKWGDAHAHWLRSADVIVCRDRDESGRRHAETVIASLHGTAASVRLVEPIDGKDVAEHLSSGHSVQDLHEIELPATATNDADRQDDEPDTWLPIDLGPYLRGEIQPVTPSVGLSRTDGLQLLYPGKEHSVLGEMESGKSWFCLACAAAELAADRHVVYIHFEESDPSGTVERLHALGVPSREIEARFWFVGPERRVTPDGLARLLDPTPSLVILDGVNEAMALHGWGIREEDGVALFRRWLVKPCTRAGAATLSADHVVKDIERRGRSALGSVHKVNGLSGTLIALENADAFGRGQRGRSHVYVTKDRPGYLRRHGRATTTAGKTFMAELIVDDTQTAAVGLDLRLYAPSRDEVTTDDPHPKVADEVYAALGAVQGAAVSSERQLLAVVRAAGCNYRKTVVQDAVDDLIAAGRVEEFIGKRKARGYRVTASQDPPTLTASRTASATASPIEGGRGTQSQRTASGRSGTQTDADGTTELEAG